MVNILKMQLHRVPLRPVVAKGKRIIPCRTDVVAVLSCFAENGVDAPACADMVLQLDACMEGFSEQLREQRGQRTSNKTSEYFQLNRMNARERKREKGIM